MTSPQLPVRAWFALPGRDASETIDPDVLREQAGAGKRPDRDAWWPPDHRPCRKTAGATRRRRVGPSLPAHPGGRCRGHPDGRSPPWHSRHPARPMAHHRRIPIRLATIRSGAAAPVMALANFISIADALGITQCGISVGPSHGKMASMAATTVAANGEDRWSGTGELCRLSCSLSFAAIQPGSTP
jgi:hypothetical protein